MSNIKSKLLVIILTFVSFYACSQCGVIQLNTQQDVDNFPSTFPNCTEAALIISGSSINDLSPLGQITQIINLEISNTSLVNLDGLGNNTQVPGFIRITENPNLENINDLIGTNGDGFELTIFGNNSLENVDGLINVISFRQIFIVDNPELENLDGIQDISLNHPEAELRLRNNDSMISFPAFTNVVQLSVLEISDNSLIPSINGFNNLTDFNFNFSFPTLIINNNAAITSINGFSSLQNSLMDIQFNSNNSLESITGFDLAANGVKNMSIQMNPLLDNISFCDNLDASAFEVVVIRNNPILSLCNSVSLCDYAQSNPSVGTFLLNACGCNSRDEVLDVCNGGDPCDCGDPVVDILEEFYMSTNGNQWTNNTGWLEDCDYCNWFGVTCDANQNVIGLNLQNNNLSGTLPPSVCQLGFLQDIILNENSIGGDIPSCIGGMQNLIRLTLSTNDFTGMIPDFFNTPNLGSLDLQANNLTGSIPPSIGDLPLLTFAVAFNNLSGCYDPNLMNLCQPWILPGPVSNGNNFDASWFDFCATGAGSCCSHPDLPGLQALYDATNGDTWDNTLANDTPWFEDCDPCGLIDGTPWYGIICNSNDRVEQLKLQLNGLTGTLTSDISLLSELEWLELTANQLSGSLPSSICSLPLIEYISVGNNQLSGTMPTCVNALTTLRFFLIFENAFTGPLPSFDANNYDLVQIWAYDNMFTGSIPSDYSDLIDLTDLLIYNNNLTGCYESTLTTLCSGITPPIVNGEVSDGNSFDAPWEDFCSMGLGACTVNTDELFSSRIKIYPTVSSGFFTIETIDMSEALFSVYDITGKQITNISSTQDKSTLDLSDQEAGLYLIQVRSETGSISTHKVIVAR